MVSFTEIEKRMLYMTPQMKHPDIKYIINSFSMH